MLKARTGLRLHSKNTPKPKQPRSQMAIYIRTPSDKIPLPVNATPSEVKDALNALALKLQRNPMDNIAFDKIHAYMHNYLLGLVFKKFNFVRGYEEADMYQESLIALTKKAIPKFNPTKGMSFLNFAKMCINRHLITILHASRNRRKDQPINTAISLDSNPGDGDEEHFTPLANVIPDDKKYSIPYKRLSDKEAHLFALQSISSHLSPFEAVVLEEYLKEKSYRDVARSVTKRLGERFNEKSVDNALLRIRKKAQVILLSGDDEVGEIMSS